MKKLLWILALCLIAPRLASAQSAPTAIEATRVTYSRDVPKGLRAFVPRGGKSRFWGATKLKYNGQQVWVHVYDVRKINDEGVQKSALDLFVFSKPRKLKRIISNHFQYIRNNPYSKPDTIGIETLWLDLKEKTRPIIKVSLIGEKGDYGAENQYIFVIFSQDLKSAVIDKQFDEFSGVGGYTVTSFGVDEGGLLNIIYIQYGVTGIIKTTYNWLNNSFKPVKKQFKNHSEGADFKAVPLTP